MLKSEFAFIKCYISETILVTLVEAKVCKRQENKTKQKIMSNIEKSYQIMILLHSKILQRNGTFCHFLSPPNILVILLL